MVYHLSIVEIIHEINHQDTPLSPKLHISEMNITHYYIMNSILHLITLIESN